jgi:uncharacterized protein (TIGR03067 family)
MSLRTLPACLMAPLFALATWLSVAKVGAFENPAEFKPGTKVIVDVGGESVGQIVEQVAPGVYRVRVTIHTGDVIHPALPAQSLRLAPAGAVVGTQLTKPNAAPAAANSGSATPGTATSGTATSGTATSGNVTSGTVTVTPGTTTPGTVTSGTVTPGSVTPGTATAGTVTPGTVTPGTVTQGTVIITPGTVTPGTVRPGRVTPGTVTQGTTTPGTVTQGTATPGTVTPGTITPGTVTPGTVTPGTVIPGTATSGTSRSGTVTVTPGAVNPGVVREPPLAETPAGKAELRSLVGTWNVLALRHNGRPDPRAPQAITITATSITLGNRVFDQVRLDPTSDPRRMDLAMIRFERPLRAIYERDGDRLRICLTPGEDSLRPTDFQTTEDDGRTLYECELAK